MHPGHPFNPNPRAASATLAAGVRITNARKHLLEIVRLQEFTVVQQVGQMSHKPPVAQGNAVFGASRRKKKLSLLLPRTASTFPPALLTEAEAL